MQVYAIRCFNFMRFGEKDNSVLLDILPEDQILLDKNEITVDEIYERMLKDPIAYVENVKILTSEEYQEYLMLIEKYKTTG